MKRDVRVWMPWASVAVDVVLINLALRIAYWLRYNLQLFRSVDPANNVPFSVYVPMAVLLTVLLLVSHRREGAYDLRISRSLLDEWYAIINATTTGIALLVVFVFFYRRLFYSRIIFVYAGILIVVLLGLARMMRRAVLAQMRQAGKGVDRVLIVGAGEVGRTVMRNIIAEPERGYRIIGFLDDDPLKSGANIGPIQALGPIDNLPQILREHAIDQLVITLPWQYHRKIVRLVAESEQEGVRARVVPDLFQLSLGGVDVEDLNGIPLIGIKESSLTGMNQVIKRTFDLGLASTALLILAPVMLAVAAAIKLDSPGPVLFRQLRAGRDGQPFTFFKFRSMRMNAEAELDELRQHNEADGPLFKMREDPTRDSRGSLCPAYQPGRVAAALQRAARRDEPGRTAPTDSF